MRARKFLDPTCPVQDILECGGLPRLFLAEACFGIRSTAQSVSAARFPPPFDLHASKLGHGRAPPALDGSSCVLVLYEIGFNLIAADIAMNSSSLNHLAA